jgi:FtsP/CotA-like multicopper oxidase with cupredoxin domain
VTNQSNETQDSNVLYSGVYDSNPHWGLRLSEGNATRYDLTDSSDGRLTATDVATGPAIWTAAGSIGIQYLHKNGNLVGSDSGPTLSVTGSYPLTVGAMVQGTSKSAFYTGQIGEVVVYDSYLSTTQTQEVEGYLACKWGLQTRLPANHPYRYVCPQGGTPTPLPIPTPSPPGISNPPELRSSNGKLMVTITAQANATTGYPQLVYNGSSTPPTLRLLPGDTLYVTLTNNLPQPPGNAGYTNYVNLHYHGLHVSPIAPGDDSIDMIAAPGQSLNYVISIPTNHPPGLYWYHTHVHGEVDRDTLAGMSGALVIDGIVNYSPQVANLPERILIVRNAPLAGGSLPDANRNQLLAMRWAMQRGLGMHGSSAGIGRMTVRGIRRTATYLHGSTNAATRNPYVTVNPNYRRFIRANITGDGQCVAGSPQSPSYAFTVNGVTVNGVTPPSIAIRPGEQQFWRVVNAGADAYLSLAIDNVQMKIIALDGVPLGSGLNTPASMNAYNWVVPPGGRVEFIITGPPAGAYMRSLCFDSGPTGAPMPAAMLATLNANASPTDLLKLRHVQRRAPTTQMRFLAHSPASIRAHAVSNTRTVYYNDQYEINGTSYNPSGPPMYYVQSGTTEEWTIVNTSTQVHTFHIHQVHFLVEAINGATQPQQYMMDDVNVPAATTSGPGTVKVLLDFTDPTIIGTFLFHCHILSHEDAGMMAKIEVGKAPPLVIGSPPVSSVSFASPTSPSQNVSVSGGTAPYSVTGCTGVASAAVSGDTVALKPAASGSCVLTIADSSTPALSGTVTVNVAAPPPAITVSPQSVAFAAVPLGSAQNVTVAGGTPPYTTSGCTGIASASVSGTNLTVTPAGIGTCTIKIVDAANNTASLPVSVNTCSTGAPLDNLTFHQNCARLGWYQNEVALNTTTVAPSSFGLLTSLPVNGKVYAQPLFVTNQTAAIDGKMHNLVIIATETDQIYAFDETTHNVIWHRDFTGPGVTPQSFQSTGCTNVNPYIGITGTPVIDRTVNNGLGNLYVVVATTETGIGFVQRLHAISLASGADTITPTTISGSDTIVGGGTAHFDAEYNMNRGALLEANGLIYVAFGSHCDYDANTTHGWLFAYSPTSLTQVGSTVDTTNAAGGEEGHFLGSPWMGGYGPAADSEGNIYIATGNGPFDGLNNFGDSVLKLPGNLSMTGMTFFAPSTATADGLVDADLGSGGAMVLPDQLGPHLLAQAGKCDANNNCYKRLLNRDLMGGQTANDAGVAAKLNTGGPIYGGPAYFEDASGMSHIVYGGGQPLITLNVNTSPVSLSTPPPSYNFNIAGGLEGCDQGSQPVVSSNGTLPGTAVVWVLYTPGCAGGSIGGSGRSGPITLYALNALNLSKVLYTGAAGNWTKDPGATTVGEAMVSPLVADGRVYVPTDGAVAVFGLQPQDAIKPRR